MKQIVLFLLMAVHAFAVSPVARWPLDDQTGTTVIRDVIGTTNGTWAGTELVTNGDFGTGDLTGWPLNTESAYAVNVGDQCVGTADGVQNLFLGQDFSAVVGKSYIIQYEIIAGTNLDGDFLMSALSSFDSTVLPITDGIHSVSLTATHNSALQDLAFQIHNNNTLGKVVIIDNISVREAAFSKGTGITFDGVGEYIDIGTGPASVKTVSLWIKLDDVSGNEFVMDLNNSDYLTVGSGVVTIVGFTAPTLYVNGVEGTSGATTIPALTWSHIVITDTTASNATDLDIGRVTSFYYDGLISDVRLYSVVLTADQVKGLFKGEERKLRARYNNKEYEPSRRSRYN